jgi:hypothetical protein
MEETRQNIKECTKCGLVREHYRDKSRLSGFHPYCKICSDSFNKHENKRISTKKSNNELRKKVLLKLGQTCVCCGVQDWWNLTLDHIEPVKGNRIPWRKLYNSVLIDSEGYQCMCYGCNNSKNLGDKCTLDH